MTETKSELGSTATVSTVDKSPYGYGMEINGSQKTLEKEYKETPQKMTQRQIIKNLLVVSIAFLFLFTSFQSLTNLQSTLNSDEGLGTGGLSIIYGALIISCMFIPSIMIAKIGCKWTIAASMICYILYMAANFYAEWEMLAPASVIIGLGAAPLWSAKCTYLTETGNWYHRLTGQSEDAIINRFFGIFFMTFQTSQIWGNLISSTILSQKGENTTYNVSSEILTQCGANYCPGIDFGNTTNLNLQRPPLDRVYMLMGVYTACAVVGFLIIVFLLDPIVLDRETEGGRGKVSLKLFVATFKHLWKYPEQKLLIPLTIYSGIEQAFVAGEFTRSYVSCTMGIWNVGYVMICFGVTDAICSFAFGRLVQYVGHIPFFIFAALLHGSIQIALLLWVPTPDDFIILFVFAACWGMGDAVVQTQINALYGQLWTGTSEAAFANYRLWESTGFIMAFAYGGFLCTYIKLYICLAFIVVGMIGYAAVEVMMRRKAANSHQLNH